MDSDEGQSTPVKRPRRLWPWFVSGFLLVFLGLLFLFQIHAMHPSGQYVMSAPLWQYYIKELRPLFATHTTLGPASSDGSGLLVTMFVHSLISAVGGGVGVGLGWFVGTRVK